MSDAPSRVVSRGRSAVKAGFSQLATGLKFGELMGDFPFTGGCEITAYGVTSEAVAAVVGMQKMGKERTSCPRRGLPTTNSHTSVSPWATRPPIALAASITDPPPKASTPSAPNAVASAAIRLMVDACGFGSMPRTCKTSTLCLASKSVTVATYPRRSTEPPPVTRSTFLDDNARVWMNFGPSGSPKKSWVGRCNSKFCTECWT